MSYLSEKGIWKYQHRLPRVTESNRISLGEGQTPLIKSCRIGKALGLDQLYFKLESSNPTGSYKDRISALGVSLAKENGRSACTGTTSGNAGGSIAAYAARAGLTYNVYVQENIVASKLEPMIVYRANVTKVLGFGFRPEVGNRVFAKVLENAASNNWEMLVTAYAFAPQAMEAVKTIAYEVAEELIEDNGEEKPAIFVPVGGGGLLSGIHRGYVDLTSEGIVRRLPRMIACQSSGCANVAKAWKLGLNKPVDGESTAKISGIQVPNPPDAVQVLQALRDSDGFAEEIADEETWYWQEQMAVQEGIFSEPAGAIALAGAARALKEGRIGRGTPVVCIVSGAGYKDANRVAELVSHAAAIPTVKVDTL